MGGTSHHQCYAYLNGQNKSIFSGVEVSKIKVQDCEPHWVTCEKGKLNVVAKYTPFQSILLSLPSSFKSDLTAAHAHKVSSISLHSKDAVSSESFNCKNHTGHLHVNDKGEVSM